MSGIVQAISNKGRREFLSWCDEGYSYIKTLDLAYSEWLCVPRSIKTTSVKPSGTVSLLCGATPGIHYPHSEYYIRNIRVANTSPLIKIALDAGYGVEQDVYANDTSVISFPVREKFFTKSKDNVTIWEQFTNAADMQQHWADNQVSITVTFRKGESEDIKSCLETFETKLKSISLLPLNEEDHGYEQAPYIKISESDYNRLTSQLKPMNLSGSNHEVDEKFCDGDSCVL